MKPKVIKISRDGVSGNTYIVTADNRTGVVIDPSEPGTWDEVMRRGIVCPYVLLTHGHFDHVGGCREFNENGANIICSEREKGFIFSPENLGIFGGVDIPLFMVSRTLRDGEQFNLCGINFTAIATPGHTAGSMCYLSYDNLFTGDTLFKESVGRTDLPTGSQRDLYYSLKKLSALEGDYKIYAGHGANSTLSHEREYNPFIH